MRLKLIITFALVALLFSGCISSRGAYEPGYKTITTRGYSTQGTQSSSSRSSGVYSAALHVNGDLSYIDRKYFKRAFEAKVEDRGINIDYNSPNNINVKVTKSILDTRSSGGAAYQNCSAFKLDRKVVGTVEYIIRGKSTYADSINYKFIVKSSSCISYDDAERKARLLLIKKLGSLTAKRVLKHRNILNKSNSAGCAVR